MKTFGKIFSILFLVLFVGILAGCNTPGEITLDSPTNVTITNGVVSWNAVADATEYRVVVGTNTYTVTTTTYDLKTLSLSVGTHQVTVIAVKGTTVSMPSQLVNYVVASEEPTSLAAPTNVTINNGILSWNAVPNATAYRITINSVNYTTTQTTYDLKTITLPTGTYSVTVVATRNTLLSPASAAASYLVLPVANADDIYAAVLLMIDDTYVPDMQESDFDDEWEFENYQNTARLLRVYSDTAISLSMSFDNAVDMFEHIYTMISSMDGITSATELKTQLDQFGDFGLTSQSVSIMIMELGSIAFDMGLESALSDLAYFEDELESIALEIATIKASSDYTSLYNKLSLYAGTDVTTLDLLIHDFENGNYNDIWWLFDIISQMAFNALNNPEADPWYLDYEDPYIDLFYLIVSEAVIEEDIEFLSGLAYNYYSTLLPLMSIHNQSYNLHYAHQRIADIEQQMVFLNGIIAMMEEEYDMLQETMEGVLTFVVDLYDSIPLTMITKLDTLMENGELTMAEYILLKNEIVAMLQDNLPTAADFGTMYATLFQIAASITDINMTDVAQHATLLGQVDYILIGLMLEMVADVDQTMIEEISAIVNDLMIPGEFIDDEWGGYWTDDQVNFPKAIELAIYIGNYLEDFKTTHAIEFAALAALPIDDAMEDFVIFATGIIKSQMMLEMDEEEFALVSLVIDELIADYDNILAGIQVLMNLGVNVFDEFLTSEGQFMLDVYELILYMDESDDLEFLVSEIERIFGGFAAYNVALMGDLDQVAFEKILRIVRVPLMIQILQEGIIDFETFNTLFDELLTPISTVLANIVTIEQQIITTIDSAELVLFFAPLFAEETLDQQVFMMRVLAMVTIVADEAINTQIEDLIFASLTTVFDDILGHEDVMGLTGMTQTDIDDLYNMINQMVQDKLDALRIVAQYDFDNLSQSEQEAFFELFDFLFGMEEEQPTL